MRGARRGSARPSARSCAGDRVPPQRAEVVDRGDEAGEQLERRRAGLVAPADRDFGAGRTLYGRHDSSSSRRPNASPRCGPKNLYGEQSSTSAPSGRDVDRAVRRVVDGVDPGERPRLVRERGDPRPRPARSRPRSRPTGTRRRASGRRAGGAGRRGRASCRRGRRRTGHARRRRRASWSHGDTFASWSSFVTRISSPGRSSRASARVSAKFSVVMLAPKATSSWSQPRKSAAASLALVTSASVARLVAKAPPEFAFASRKWAEIASMTSSGTCVPPGPSKNASGPSSAA